MFITVARTKQRIIPERRGAPVNDLDVEVQFSRPTYDVIEMM